MLNIASSEVLAQQVKTWKSLGDKIAFVPTMGNLHQGHLSLVREAGSLADRVVVSIYVNPLQFSAGEDLSTYPRTLSADQKSLMDLPVDLLFLPVNDVMYAEGLDDAAQVIIPGLSGILCGESRPTHFAGVTTVVNKLLNLVQPDIAIFGEKDFQQVFMIKKMVADLFMPIEVVASPIVRESDGLAMSSRNQYLAQEERQQASLIYQTLLEIKERATKGGDFRELELIAINRLSEAEFKVDYVSFRSTRTLSLAENSDEGVVFLIAAWLGKTRLIDNIRVF